MRAHSLAVTVALFMGSVTAASPAADPPAPVSATTKRTDDRVTVAVRDGRATVDIHSPTGISHAVLERTGDRWPERLTVRLHLRGLERLELTNGAIDFDPEAGQPVRHGTIGLSTSVSGGSVTRPIPIYRKTGAPPLAPADPLWIDLRLFHDDGRRADQIPLQDGFFDIPLPPAFFEGNPKAITVNWVDFYRG